MGFFDNFNMCNPSSTLYQTNEISKAFMRNENDDDDYDDYDDDDEDDQDEDEDDDNLTKHNRYHNRRRSLYYNPKGFRK